MSILICIIPLTIGWGLIAFANTLTMLLIGRLFLGFTFGWSYSVLPMYLAEIASSQIRGAIANSTIILQNIGIMFAFTICPLVSIQTFAWISLTIPICGAAIFVWLPESPYYLVEKNESNEAYRCLAKLRRTTDVQEEFNEIVMAVQYSEKKSNKFQDLLTPNTRKSLTLIIALCAIGQLSGWIAIISYAQILFEKIGAHSGANVLMLILGLLQLFACFLSSIALDKLGRRILLLTSLGVVGICHLVLAVYFSAGRYYRNELANISWLPIVIIFVYIVASNIGIGTVPNVILGEIFPANLKALATTVYIVVATSLNMCVAKLFQVFIDSFGNDIPFWLFAGFCFSFWPYFWYALPETKGKTLNEILNKINARK